MAKQISKKLPPLVLLNRRAPKSAAKTALQNARVQSAEIGPSFKSTQVLEMAKAKRPELKAALPWATLSARRPYVKDKADATFWRTGHVSGYGDEVNLASSWAHPEAQIGVAISKVPAEMFLVIVHGWCNGAAALHFQSDTGSGTQTVGQGAFSCPVAVTDTDDDAYLAITVTGTPALVSVKRIEIWKVD